MTSAVIVSTARTPLAKSWKGSFNLTHGATLGGHAVQHAIARAGIDAGEVDDVLMGCATPEGATGANIARQIALVAGCPVTTSGMTVTVALKVRDLPSSGSSSPISIDGRSTTSNSASAAAAWVVVE